MLIHQNHIPIRILQHEAGRTSLPLKHLGKQLNPFALQSGVQVPYICKRSQFIPIIILAWIEGQDVVVEQP